MRRRQWIPNFRPLSAWICCFAAARAGTVAYWTFDGEEGGDRHLPAVGGAAHALVSSVGNGFSRSARVAADPIPNPDATAGFAGARRANTGSLFSQGGLTRYLRTRGDATVALNLAGNRSWTFEGWFQLNGPVGAGSFDVLWTTRDAPRFRGMHLVVNADGTATFLVDAEGGRPVAATWGSGLIRQGDWAHVAVAFDGGAGVNGRFDFFINGVRVGRLDLPAGLNRAALDANDLGHLRFAGRAEGTVSLNGRLDEWRISNRVLPLDGFLVSSTPVRLP